MATDAHRATTAHRLDGPMPDPAQGVFETTLVVDGRPLALEAHLARLRSSLDALYGDPLPPRAGDVVAEAAAGIEVGRVRITVLPGGDETAAAVPVDRALVFPGRERALELVAVTVPGGIGAHKWADRRLLERAEELVSPAAPLVVDSDGAPLEGSRGSLFCVRGATILTPPADGRLLPGITRAQAIEAARGLGLEVREQPLDLERLAGADEIFMTGAVRGVEPVRSCADVGEWDFGEVTARVTAELRRLWLA
jgi:para-aminobenzoate synthetase / 4-amino-4-deoxychorismate lyase